jgi:flagellar basal body-associated protein FliL
VSKKLIIIIVAALPLLGGGGYFGYTMLLAPPVAKAASPKAAEKAMKKKMKVAMKLRIKMGVPGMTIPLSGDFIVNLGGLAHFAKFDVSLLVDKGTKSLPAASGATDPSPTLVDNDQIRDIVITDTSRYDAGDLATPGGKAKLKKRIMKDVDEKTETVALSVYFTNFAIQ